MARPQQAVPVFPLPGLVLFPHVALPLHVFELRYRTMVRDALSADRTIAMALLKPGWERDYQGSPEFHPLVCLARIVDVEWLPNDCYDLRVKGFARARVSRVAREFPYRAVLCEECPQHPIAADDPLVGMERASVLEACQRLARPVGAELDDPETLDFEALVNLGCTLAPMEASEKLALLEEDSVFERALKLRDWVARKMPDDASANPEGGENN